MRRVASTSIVGLTLVVAACGSDTPVTAPSSSTSTTTTTTTTTTIEPELVDMTETVRVTYGDELQQFAELSLPAAADDVPVVVLIHGGFWRTPYDLTLMKPLADDLVQRGYAVWNLEYRRIGDPGGAWPGTLTDVAAGIDALAAVGDEHPLDLDRIAFVGHSAGGHLALWSAGRASLPDGAPGAMPAITPRIAIGQGGVVDLRGAAEARLGRGAVLELLGGTADEFGDRYDWATPALDASPEMVSVAGTLDDIVPPAFSIDPAQPASIELVLIEDADHFAHIDAGSAAWLAVVDRLDAALLD